MTHWHQHACGDLPDGSRVMVVSVEADDWRRHKTRSFEAVLICTADGLHRLWRNGRSRLLAPGYLWPRLQRAEEAEKSLGSLVPKSWGTQRDGGCVIKNLPGWILKARTANLARLLLAWSRSDAAAHTERVRSATRPCPWTRRCRPHPGLVLHPHDTPGVWGSTTRRTVLPESS